MRFTRALQTEVGDFGDVVRVPLPLLPDHYAAVHHVVVARALNAAEISYALLSRHRVFTDTDFSGGAVNLESSIFRNFSPAAVWLAGEFSPEEGRPHLWWLFGRGAVALWFWANSGSDNKEVWLDLWYEPVRDPQYARLLARDSFGGK